MTDNDIIKALEEWIKELKADYKRLQLLDAPMDCFEESHVDNIRVLSNALDLINRQKAEIENMFSERTYKALYETAKTKINKLQWQVNNLKKYDEERDIRLHARLTEEARKKAIKEVIERIKEEFPNATSPFHNYGIEMYLDNLKKEMEGEGK